MKYCVWQKAPVCVLTLSHITQNNSRLKLFLFIPSSKDSWRKKEATMLRCRKIEEV